MHLILSAEILNAIARHAAACFPEEACGILLGHAAADAVHVAAAEPAPNIARGRHRRRHRYLIDPRILLAAQRSAREQQRAIVGYFHSHPDHLALPSSTDRRLAWPHYAYLIVPTTNRGAGRPRAWQLRRGIMAEMPLRHA